MNLFDGFHSPFYESKPSQIFLFQIVAIFSWNFEGFLKNALILSIFELKKCFFLGPKAPLGLAHVKII